MGEAPNMSAQFPRKQDKKRLLTAAAAALWRDREEEKRPRGCSRV